MKLNWRMLSKYRSQLYGFSILWITLFHVFEINSDKMNYPWVSSLILKNGGIGVDIFLFLSGISLYFSMKKLYAKYDDLDKKKIFKEFYKRRFSKILKVYICVCIPYFIIRYFIFTLNWMSFVKQIFFCMNKVGMFWFLGCIMLCYFIYPYIYYFMERDQKKIIYILVCVYVLMLFMILILYPKFYYRVEILFSRIPIFIIGCLKGEKVYNSEEINTYFLLFMLLLLMTKGPVYYALNHWGYYGHIASLVGRLFRGALGVGTIFFIIIMLPYFENTFINKFLCYVGSFTLEMYVVHIIIRDALIVGVHLELTSQSQVLLYTIIYLLASIICSNILNQILNPKRKIQ